MILYVSFNLIKLFGRTDDTIYTSDFGIDLLKVDPIKYSQNDITIFWVPRYTKGVETPLFDTRDTRRYISF